MSHFLNAPAADDFKGQHIYFTAEFMPGSKGLYFHESLTKTLKNWMLQPTAIIVFFFFFGISLLQGKCDLYVYVKNKNVLPCPGEMQVMG